MNFQEMQALLEKSLAPKRYKHSLAVCQTALALAEAHGLTHIERDKVVVSALLHDCGREVPTKQSAAKARELGMEVSDLEESQPILLHAALGVYYAEHKYGVKDSEILDGIRWHTTGTADMSVLAKIIYLADMIEPGRDFPGIDKLRKLAYKDLDRAMLMAYANTINYLTENQLLIHPACIAGYNQLLLAFKRQEE